MPDDPQQAQTLAQLVRAKYPGVYDSLSDADLEAKVKAKYPGVYDHLPTSQAAPSTPSEDMGLGGPIDLVRGIGAGLASTVYHGGDLIRRGLGMNRIINDPIPQAAMTAPNSIAGQVGKLGEQVGEFFLPSGEVGAGMKALKTGSKFAKTAIRAGLEGLSAAGIGTLQTGSPSEGGITGAVTAGTTAALGPLTKVLKPLGEKIETVLVKPGAADYADGFNVKNIFKYDVGGTLGQSFDKVKTKIDDLALRARQMVRSSPATVDLADVFARARAKFAANATRTVGLNEGIEAAFQKLERDPEILKAMHSGGKVNLPTVQDLKMAMGDLGAWMHDPTGRVMADPNSKAMEQVANTLYDEFKKELEQKAVGPLKFINQQMSDLIPIRRAIIRRLPVEARSNLVNLSDIVALSHGSGWLAVLNHVLKSGPAANAMVKASESSAAPVAGKVAGALYDQSQ